MCGWAQGCYSADVDALLFGAVAVYRSLPLSTLTLLAPASLTPPDVRLGAGLLHGGC